MYADLGSRGSTWMHHLKSLREGLSDAWPDLVNFVLSGLSWATFLGGQARSWKARRCLIRVMKHGARILLGQNDLLQQTAQVLVGMSWLYTLSSGGLFLAAAVIVDRFDRWLAEGRQPSVT